MRTNWSCGRQSTVDGSEILRPIELGSLSPLDTKALSKSIPGRCLISRISEDINDVSPWTHRSPSWCLPCQVPCLWPMVRPRRASEEWWPGLQPKPVLNVPCLKTEGCFQKIVGFPPKSSILIGISIINHPYWGKTLFLETPRSLIRAFTKGNQWFIVRRFW